MNKETQFHCSFYLPEKPDARVFGKLSFSVGSCGELELMGKLSKSDSWDDFKVYPIVIGEMPGKGYWILWKNSEYEFEMEGTRSKLTTIHSFFSKDLIQDFTPEFTGLELSLNSLWNWIGKNRFTETSKDSGFGFQVALPDSIQLFQNDDLRVNIGFGCGHRGNSSNVEEKILHASTTLFGNWSNEKPLAEVTSLVFRLRLLWSIFTGVQLGLDNLKLVHKSGIEVEYFMPTNTEGSAAPPHLFQPFPYDVIKDHVSAIISNLLASENVKQTQAAFDILYSENLRLPTENYFLLLMQGVEAVDRNAEGKYMAQGKYDNEVYHVLASAIPKCVEKDHRQALKSRLKYGNEFSLRRRLKRQVENLSENLRYALKIDVPTFIAPVVDTRNHLIHRDFASAENQKIFSSVELIGVCHQLKFLLLAQVLLNLGVPCALVSERLQFQVTKESPRVFS